MSDREKDGAHEEHRRASELHDASAHTHMVAAESRDHREHLTPGELSRQELEHSNTAHPHTEEGSRPSATFNHADIATLAHELWVGRGSPQGSPEEDWFLAAKQLRARWVEKKLTAAATE